jgi:hypothetical protein
MIRNIVPPHHTLDELLDKIAEQQAKLRNTCQCGAPGAVYAVSRSALVWMQRSATDAQSASSGIACAWNNYHRRQNYATH